MRLATTAVVFAKMYIHSTSSGSAFQMIWNNVPDDMEYRSRWHGTVLQLIWNKIPDDMEHGSILHVTRRLTKKLIAWAYLIVAENISLSKGEIIYPDAYA